LGEFSQGRTRTYLLKNLLNELKPSVRGFTTKSCTGAIKGEGDKRLPIK
jgi:hypothetical protein